MRHPNNHRQNAGEEGATCDSMYNKASAVAVHSCSGNSGNKNSDGEPEYYGICVVVRCYRKW